MSNFLIAYIRIGSLRPDATRHIVRAGDAPSHAKPGRSHDRRATSLRPADGCTRMVGGLTGSQPDLDSPRRRRFQHNHGTG